MKRRLELARGLIHRPKVLFLDEPTLGLDPQARHNIWQYVLELRTNEGITIFMTTHYMDEAENCDRIAIVDDGSIVALGTPEELKQKVGGDVITLKAENNNAAKRELRDRYSIDSSFSGNNLTFTVPQGDKFLPKFVRESNQQMQSISVRRPTLDDVFLKLTGHTLRDESVNTRTGLSRSKWGPSRR